MFFCIKETLIILTHTVFVGYRYKYLCTYDYNDLDCPCMQILKRLDFIK